MSLEKCKAFSVIHLVLRPPTAVQGEYKRTMVAEAQILSERKNLKLFLL